MSSAREGPQKEYQIRRVPGGETGDVNGAGDDDVVPLNGDPTAGPWPEADALVVGEYPWREEKAPPAATVRVLYDDDALYVQYQVDDDHIQAEERSFNGPVSRDSCVELFAGPHPDRPHYVNVETNCTGQLLLGYGPNREERRLATASVAEPIRIETSVPGPRKEPSPEDAGWWLAVAIPFETLSQFVGEDVSPEPGTCWRGNVYCCRGAPEPRYVVWSPIDSPEPDFHRPEAFGTLAFE